MTEDSKSSRYQRQERFAPLGRAGQARLAAGRVLIVGLGGLGSWLAELLGRAGVGFLRLVDDDCVDWTNLPRQGMYDESDAATQQPKVLAAAKHLAKINSAITVEPITEKLTRRNIADLAAGVDLILDGTDCWASRFLINDFAVKTSLPWIFAGVVRVEGQVMVIPPGGSPCLRCICETPPPEQLEAANKAASVGVLGTAVTAIAALEATEAIKLLAGCPDATNPHLTKLDLWKNSIRQLAAAEGAAENQCPCCKQRRFEFLEP